MNFMTSLGLGVGRFLKWGVVEARGAVMNCEDNKVLELIGMEKCIQFIDCEDNFSWVFSGVYQLKGETEKSFGQSRGYP